MACSSDRSQSVGDFLAGRLTENESVELLDHIESCEACSEELDLAASLVAGSEEDFRDSARVREVPRGGRLLVLVAAAAAAVLLVLAVLPDDDGDRSRNFGDLAAIDAPPYVPSAVRGDREDRGPGWARALEDYAAGDFTRAASALGLIARDDDALAQFYLGVALLKSGDHEGASNALERAATHATGLLSERARWYRAHAELGRARPNVALAILNELIARGGDYSFDAEELAEEIEARLER